MADSASGDRRFAIALSFPGEYRKFVGEVADALAATFGKGRVLYDKHHEAEFARLDLDVYLPNLYRTQSELLVVFLCPEYATKRWTNLEWRHIRQLIATIDASRVMFVSFGNPGDLTSLGILAGDGYIDIGTRSAEEIVNKIIERFSINGGVVRHRDASTVASTSLQFDISRIDSYAPELLIGRESELAFLTDAWDNARNGSVPRPHVITIVALGGEGKTSLVAKWAASLAAEDWRDCEMAFAWSFYSQGRRDQMTASSDLFLKEALTYFGDPQVAASAVSAFDKGRRLAKLVGGRRALLTLDGLEPLQYAPTSSHAGYLKDQGITALLKGLAATNAGLCVVTTRYTVTDLRAYRQTTAPEMNLARLPKSAGVALLQSLGVRGSTKELETLVEDVKGHALTVNLLGTFLRDAHGGDIKKRDLIRIADANEVEQGGHAFRVIDAYVKWLSSEAKGARAVALLRTLGLFDRPATAECLRAIRQPPVIRGLTKPLVGLSEADWNINCRRLEAANLVTVNRDASGATFSVDAHPLLREHFAQDLRAHDRDAWQVAHRRLYDYLRDNTQDKAQPTLEDLQPLYEAVAHGCHALMQPEAMDLCLSRIWRRHEMYTIRKLGAFASDLGAISCFFDEPWRRVAARVRMHDRSFLLGAAAFCLRALGRSTEALQPTRAGLAMDVERGRWTAAAAQAGNLSELEDQLGELEAAMHDGDVAVRYAERSGNLAQIVSKLTTSATVRHHAGLSADAERLFSQAETAQAEGSHYSLLYSVRGFQYCDLLLASAERAAWIATVSSDSRRPHAPTNNSGLHDSCETVFVRARQVQEWEESMRDAPLLDFALNHLTMSRAKLFASILEPAVSELAIADSHVTAAVDGLRRAAYADDLPQGLLTRAWLRCVRGIRMGSDSARTDLDEAWEIADRGQMRLVLADIHMYRARLFRDVKPYPWSTEANGQLRGPRDDLDAARSIIERCGYWRRKEELEDAEAAAKDW